MKKILIILGLIFMACACKGVFKENPYAGQLHSLKLNLVYAEGEQPSQDFRAKITVENIINGTVYTATVLSDANISLPNGKYRVSASGKEGLNVYNGLADNVRLIGSDLTLTLEMTRSEGGTIVIKEIYCGGCKKTDAEHPDGYGDYQSDKYIIFHNNSTKVQYLDSLCFGSLDPYRSPSESVWVGKYDFAPIIQAVLQFPGDGKSFPLQPGEDAVVCICGAIDHAAMFPKSVNLNNENYFVLYNIVHFPNETYHPTPGDKIRPDHYLNIPIKVGQANAYTLAIQSPAVVVFRPKGMTIEEYVALEGSVIQKPGSNVDRIVAVPWDWVIDAVEVFENSTSNKKRIDAGADAGYVLLSEIYAGHTLLRKVDAAATAEYGFEVLQDTNNSTNDFIESKIQTLHADYGK